MLLLEGCPITDAPPEEAPRFVGLIIAIAVPIITKIIIDGAKSYIDRAKDELTADYVAMGAEKLVDPEKECLVIARGTFGPLRTKYTDQNNPDYNPEAQVGSLKVDHLKDVGLSDFPALYIEAWLRREGAARIIIEPQVLHFADSAAKRTDADAKFIGVLLAMSETAPDPSGEAGRETVRQAAVAVVPFQFPDVAEGVEYIGQEKLRPAGSENQPPEYVYGDTHPLYDQRRAVSFAGGNGEPMNSTLNLFAFVTETEDPSPFYKILSDAIPQGEAPLKEALEALGAELGGDES